MPDEYWLLFIEKHGPYDHDLTIDDFVGTFPEYQDAMDHYDRLIETRREKIDRMIEDGHNLKHGADPSGLIASFRLSDGMLREVYRTERYTINDTPIEEGSRWYQHEQ